MGSFSLLHLLVLLVVVILVFGSRRMLSRTMHDVGDGVGALRRAARGDPIQRTGHQEPNDDV